MILNRGSKPTLERDKVEKSKFLIATSSIEQHGYEQRIGRPPMPAPGLNPMKIPVEFDLVGMAPSSSPGRKNF